MKPAKFKVGDKVSVVGNVTAFASKNYGYVGIVTKVCSEHAKDTGFIGYGGYYYILDDFNGRSVWQNDIALVKSEGFITKDSGARQKYDSGMQRDIQDGKPRYDLIVPEGCKNPMLKRWAELLQRGMAKYGYRNWEKANSIEELIRFKASAFRHFMQWMMDENDEDHASAVFFNIQATEFVKEKMQNDRPTEKRKHKKAN